MPLATRYRRLALFARWPLGEGGRVGAPRDRRPFVGLRRFREPPS
jgi:hypothetical protein